MKDWKVFLLEQENKKLKEENKQLKQLIENSRWKQFDRNQFFQKQFDKFLKKETDDEIPNIEDEFDFDSEDDI